jgi:hypothetical protein
MSAPIWGSLSTSLPPCLLALTTRRGATLTRMLGPGLSQALGLWSRAAKARSYAPHQVRHQSAVTTATKDDDAGDRTRARLG